MSTPPVAWSQHPEFDAFIAEGVERGDSWPAIAEDFEDRFGVRVNSESVRKRYALLRGPQSQPRPPETREDRRSAERTKTLEKDLRATQAELDRLQDVQSLIEGFDRSVLRIPEWTYKAPRRGGHRAIATLQLSDTHFDEVIKAPQILGYNRYDRDIALKRLRKTGEKTIEVARDYIGGVDYEGIAIIATGDIFSGDIHEELRRTNEDTLLASCRFWVEPMVAFLRMLADDFGQVHVGAAVGNHGREPGKPIYKNRAQSNIEWLYWHYVADLIAAMGDKRVTFDIADGLSANMTVYQTRYAYEHGDEFKGGSGIAGARSPLLLGQHRTAVQRLAMGLSLDWLVVGHFHQYQPPAQGLIMGGSLKGYDEYAAGKKFRPEVPQQGFWVTTPERGPTVFAPIQPMDRKAEGW